MQLPEEHTLLNFDPSNENLENPVYQSNNGNGPTTVLQSWVIKMGSLLHGSAKRWFVLRSNFTLFSAKSSTRAHSPTKAYNLAGCRVEWGQLASREHCVRIWCRTQSLKTGRMGKQKKLTLIVPDLQSMTTWVSGLRCLFAGSNRLLCSENEVGGSTCAICLADFAPGDALVVLPCDHRFCNTGCIERWLSMSSQCPMCKASCLVHGVTLLRRGEWNPSQSAHTHSKHDSKQ